MNGVTAVTSFNGSLLYGDEKHVSRDARIIKKN